MGFILLGSGLFLFIKATYSFISNSIASLQYIKKIGQVVGFSEEKPGLFKVVIRFIGIDGQEYFFIDSIASRSPAFAPGEFIQILLSKKNDKIARFDHLVSIKNCILYFGLSLLIFSCVLYFYQVKLSHVLILFVVYLALSEAAKSYQFLSFFRFDAELPPAKVINVENSRLISWTQNYTGHIVFESSFRFLFDCLLKAERLIYIGVAILAFSGSIYSYMAITNQIEDSTLVKAIYDGPIEHQWTENKNFITQVPFVRYYGKDRKVIKALDKQNPFLFDLKPGTEVSVLVSNTNAESIRINRGLVNYWKSYILFLFSIILFKLNRLAGSRNAKLSSSQPVIRVRKAG